MNDYDAAIHRAKTLALESAAVGNKEKFMGLHLDDWDVRYKTDFYRWKYNYSGVFKIDAPVLL